MILSLCLPTNGVIHWVFPVLDSIYRQGVDEEQFEVVITDDGDNREFKDKIQEYLKKHTNIVYAETKTRLFTNEIEAYKRARGEFIKFVNHRTQLVDGALLYLIEYAKRNAAEKPVTYFSNGVLKMEKKQYEFDNFDEFIKALSYWSTWSTGMAIWKSDFEKLPEDISAYNALFPHTNVLFDQRNRGRYVIDNTVIFDQLPQGKTPKGNYDLYYAFGVDYPQIIEQLYKDGDITERTFQFVLKENLKFIASQYLTYQIRRKYCSYDLSGLENMFGVYYSKRQFAVSVIEVGIRKIVKKIFKIG